MNKNLIIASAGAGKTHRIVEESIKQNESGRKVLVVTYTENNQAEIVKKFKELGGKEEGLFHVKGLFTFLLEEIIRPYQTCIFPDRIENIFFNESDPHKRNGRTILGRKELQQDRSYNPIYYLTSGGTKAHTTYLAKLAAKILKESKGKPLGRLEKIYGHIYFDEVQDLVGWDYEVLKWLAKSKQLDVTCVGDFRQTIYDSSIASKHPKTSSQKRECFKKMGFEMEVMSVSRRSIQSICDFGDSIHHGEGYEGTKSLKGVPLGFQEHTGVFIVKESDALKYIKKFMPILLRYGVSSGKQFGGVSVQKVNFGKSKGLGFDRVLVVPTKAYLKFLNGKREIFQKDKTDESKNKLYVAVTRAKYSLGFVVADRFADQCNLEIWSDA